MKIFSIFKKHRKEPNELTPAVILRLTQEYLPEFYKDSKQFKDSKEFLDHNEWGLALESLIEMATESGHYFSEDFWSGLAICADKMQMMQQADNCRQQILRNENELGLKTPKGWTTIKIDNNHFQHHIAEAVKSSEQKEHRKDDFVLVTVQKLKIFKKYGASSGDYDRASSKDLKILPYDEFMFIDRLVQDIKLVEKGLAAQSYKDKVDNTLKESCDSTDTIAYLKNIAANS